MTLRLLCIGGLFACWILGCQPMAAQGTPFIVGKETATNDLIRPFQPTHLELSSIPLDEGGKQALLRGLTAEMGFAARAIPIGPPGIVLYANGHMEPETAELQRRLYQRGVSVDQGGAFQVTHVQLGRNSITLDLNGGPYQKHRFLRHLQVNGISVAHDPYEEVVGSRVILAFEGFVPKITTAEVKSLLEPILSFGAQSRTKAYTETLPDFLRIAMEQHRVLVGMTRQMVLTALGQPAMKMREHPEGGAAGEVLEEWMYGRSPETVRFVRFRANRVIQVKVAALGMPIEVHNQNELADYRQPMPEHVIPLGDTPPTRPGEDPGGAQPPSLLETSQATQIKK